MEATRVWPLLGLLLCSTLLCALFRICDGLTNNMAELTDFFGGLSPASKLGWPVSDPCNSPAFEHIVSCSGSDVTAIFIKELGLTGTLSQSVTQLPMLTRIDAQRNSLGGPVPTFNGTSAANIQTLFLGYNTFQSISPSFFSALTGIQTLSLDSNPTMAAWSLPDLTANTALVSLGLSKCGLTGTIPDSIGSLVALQNLSLSYNSLTGPLPDSLASTQLRVLQVNNQAAPGLSGGLSVLGSLPNLVIAWLHGNSFSGPLPDKLPLGLVQLIINNNHLSGPLPASMSDLTALTTLYAQNNYLSGQIPTFHNKVAMSLDTADFCSGVCDEKIGWFLTFLAAVGYPQSLAQSWVGPSVCGSWTGVVCDAAGTVVGINLPGANLNGSISPVLSNFTDVTTIVLSKNNLVGVIPGSLTSLPKLTTLDVSNNSLSPPIPPFAPTVKVLTNGNPLIDAALAPVAPPVAPPVTAPPPAPLRSPPPAPGSAPGSAPASPPVIPPVTPPSTPPVSPPGSPLTPKPSPPSSTTGEAPGSAKSPDISPSPTGVGGSSLPASTGSSSIAVGAVAGPVVAVVAFIVVAGGGFYCCYKKKRQGFFRVSTTNPSSVMIHPRDSSSDPEVVKVVVGGVGSGGKSSSGGSSGSSEIQVMEAGSLVISIQVLREVTKNFSDENVLGRGGFGVVYKGQLEDGTMIAVKRMEAAVVSSKGLDEFQAEIAVLTKVRHRHLVALLGYCADGNERLLVYEYMPKGTLSQHLFDWKNHEEKALPWKKRLSIALDVARGMEYLHGLAHKSFIHRDLKPSNILLGDDFRAKVSDFGLVKLAPEGKYSVETRLAGTFGYLAPEYAVTGRVTTKADVFSFGVVLMELITGRRALDETQAEENMHLVTWFRRTNSSKENFIKAVDATIELDEETLQTVVIVSELAGHCTAPEPYQRPDMGHAVNVLAPLVELWKPSTYDQEDNGGINMELTLPQALKQWQALGDLSMTSSVDDTKNSLPTGFADSFTSADGR